ncbi:Nitrite reductase [NAD(P)H] large subunit (EC [Bathymodiolus thermophilus thioautotrophic gill symbiont]|jgi:nitrite reductase (NADH) large subunit|uniref:Nitrite reductase [NAD(P)H] large subunit (EC) n=3 Tax=sulfur-oxidizing symbionts TaxID=32036 RepID=A0ACA8ZR43_9GAMM|nr:MULTISPECIES: nitrite reductase large subunit NirB [sulfur-oxidizing symbionts]CAC9540777.1 Nitrite reductase [NAD(P)H] large subunit (EC 1.7.1.4) [uncultured Gammaproteobacteria bacterium]CAB5496031.1 Nitrite reductase [NAD(P)H] large subunit (EC [Bathymodiolus azoricus thioautotrophic gill symbiont]CAB5499477.1 Nitrite reductase [NAD(P)H] large subunit (EC [Bathymodiolus thermophilus thioautotrophic gill symbiont]CAC9544186.1 Nitrite reductase [NAD(P)H] large subunit (EC 1.7.1.4) [uncultur
MKKLVIVGSGMSAMKVVDEVLKIDPLMYQITIIGAETVLPYNRIMLSPVLAGEKDFDEIRTHDEAYFAQNNLIFKPGFEVTAINRKAKTVSVTEIGKTDSESLDYDRLVICTGSTPFILPLPGKELAGVVSFRDIYDVEYMQSEAGKSKKVAVIGTGLLGLEAANGLNELGFKVTVIGNMDSIMNMQLDASSGHLLQKVLEQKNIHFKLGAITTKIIGKDKVESLAFEDGTTLETDMVVMSVGIVPNDTLAKHIGLQTDRGIVVNDTMMTSDPAIYSVGECIKHRGMSYGLVAPLFEQARVCAEQVCEVSHHMYTGSDISTKLKISGVDVFSAGEFDNEEDEIMCSKDHALNTRKRLSIRDNKLVGAVLFGDSTDGLFYFDLIKKETDITDIRKTLLFGDIGIDESSAGASGVEKMADDEQVCGCMGVTKGDIVNAVTDGCDTFEAMQEETGCATGCGGCGSVAKQIFSFVSGAELVSKETLCDCTGFSTAEVREYVRGLNAVKTIDEVRLALDFTSTCEACGAAINYYLSSQFNEAYVHNNVERPHNEMMHANKQRDGTYSIIPQMQGGLTTPAELKSLAEIAVKYEVPTVKVTGGQRIDLLGIPKENLNDMWDEIAAAGMESGYAYGKATRTCKSCVGTDHCMMGTQDSMGLSIKMEDAVWSHFMPHKFKMGVSGCPRNCAEVTIKDFGVICTEKGYEIHVAGACGIRTKACLKDRFFETEDEVIEYLRAFVQLYRTEGNYLERVMHFEERVGLDYIQSKLSTAEKIKQWANALPKTVPNPWKTTDHRKSA